MAREGWKRWKRRRGKNGKSLVRTFSIKTRKWNRKKAFSNEILIFAEI